MDTGTDVWFGGVLGSVIFAGACASANSMPKTSVNSLSARAGTGLDVLGGAFQTSTGTGVTPGSGHGRANRREDGRVRYAVAPGGGASGRLGAPAPPPARPTNHDQTTPGLIHAIIRRVIFLDDDCWWRWWCVRLNDNADAGADVRLIGEFPAQPAAEYPHNQNQG